MEENVTANPEVEAEKPQVSLGKFKSVDALLHAYGELESEFTRRSQRLKALEEKYEPNGNGQTEQACENGGEADEKLSRAVNENEGVRARVLADYLSSLKGVPLMTGLGTGVVCPPQRPKTISEAGSLALGYFKNSKK